MPTLEGGLIAKWREHKDLTQEEVGRACPRPITGKEVSRYERGVPSLKVATLVNVVNGLQVPGRDDAVRLGRFFLGPEWTVIEEAIAAQRQSEETSRRARRALEPFSVPQRRR